MTTVSVIRALPSPAEFMYERGIWVVAQNILEQGYVSIFFYRYRVPWSWRKYNPEVFELKKWDFIFVHSANFKNMTRLDFKNKFFASILIGNCFLLYGIFLVQFC